MSANLADSAARIERREWPVIVEPIGVRIISAFQRGSNGTWLPSITVEQPDERPIVFTAGRCHASVSARLALECAQEMAVDWRPLVLGDPFTVCKWLSGR
jgi:hypothetical protein